MQTPATDHACSGWRIFWIHCSWLKDILAHFSFFSGIIIDWCSPVTEVAPKGGQQVHRILVTAFPGISAQWNIQTLQHSLLPPTPPPPRRHDSLLHFRCPEATQTRQSSSEKVQSPGRWGRDRHKVKVVWELSIFRWGPRGDKLIMWRKSNLCLSPCYFKCQQTYNRNESESKEHHTHYNHICSWKQTWKQLGGNIQLPSVQPIKICMWGVEYIYNFSKCSLISA